MLDSSTSSPFENSPVRGILPDNEKIKELKAKAYIPAKLPDDFLRINLNQKQITENKDVMLAHQLQYGNLNQMNRGRVPFRGRLQMTFCEARLTKNYGFLAKMDPYIRVNLDGKIFETQTDYGGGKNPKWNKTIICYLPKNVDSLIIEIFDEKSFTNDEQIAVLHYTFPDEIYQGVPIDEWIPLSGKLGEQKEGHIHLQLLFTSFDKINVTQQQQQQRGITNQYPNAQMDDSNRYTVIPQNPSNVYQPATVQIPGQHTIHARQPIQQLQISQSDVDNIKEMFPSFDEDLIKSLLETNYGDQEKTINMLLQMSNDN